MIGHFFPESQFVLVFLSKWHPGGRRGVLLTWPGAGSILRSSTTPTLAERLRVDLLRALAPPPVCLA